MAVIGFIGLGNMGGPMAANLAKAGNEVRGYDRIPEALSRHAASGGRVAASVAEAVTGADVVITMLPAGAHVREVLTGPDGVARSASRTALLIDCSTIDIATARELHGIAAADGFAMLDAPVSGGVAGATAGTLTFMVGGAEQTFARAQPVFQVMGRSIIHAGGPGAGQAAKLCNNLILGISMIGVGEAFALARRLGLSDQALFDISAKSSGQCWSLTSYCPVPGPVPTSPANREYQPGFATALMLKDLTLAVQAAEQSGSATPLGDAAAAIYRRLNEAGLGGKDFSVVAEELRSGRIARNGAPPGG